VHAIGDGTLIYEVQQNSNTVYRLFDWNRTDDRGRPRQLHVEESLATIKWTLPQPRMSAPRREDAHWSLVAKTEFFTMRKLELDGGISITPDGRSFIALFAAQGQAHIRCGAGRIALPAGTSALIPAAAESCRIESEGPSTLLATTL
jgi:mannose-6-phosphate isomerase